MNSLFVENRTQDMLGKKEGKFSVENINSDSENQRRKQFHGEFTEDIKEQSQTREMGVRHDKDSTSGAFEFNYVISVKSFEDVDEKYTLSQKTEKSFVGYSTPTKQQTKENTQTASSQKLTVPKLKRKPSFQKSQLDSMLKRILKFRCKQALENKVLTNDLDPLNKDLFKDIKLPRGKKMQINTPKKQINTEKMLRQKSQTFSCLNAFLNTFGCNLSLTTLQITRDLQEIKKSKKETIRVDRQL